MGRLRAMAMGMPVRVPVMSVVGGVVVRVGVSHAEMLYYNITGVQKLEGVKVSPRPHYLSNASISVRTAASNGGRCAVTVSQT